MKIALCTMIDDNFVIGYECFMKSFMKHNNWFNNDIIIINNGLSEESKQKIESKWHRIVYKSPRKKKYVGVNYDKTHEKLRATYYKLDVFSYYEYDRIIFIDMDIVVTGNIKPIFDCKDDFAACRAYNAKQDRLMDHINSGVFVINKNKINKHIYNALVRLAQKGYSMPDQKVLNRFFAGKIGYLAKIYNMEKRMWHSERYKHLLDSVKCIHYVATKPWEKEKPNEIEASFKDVEKIWWDYYKS